ncbi:MAG TPA: hypothetical protein DDX91_03980 [Ruminococcaceae bacterium]|nr:hypothetical protein [Oscillospiraceae bacterium]
MLTAKSGTYTDFDYLNLFAFSPFSKFPFYRIILKKYSTLNKKYFLRKGIYRYETAKNRH